MNNYAAIGYMIAAAKELGVEKELIRQLESEMKHQMDILTEEQAEKEIYNNFI